MANLNFCVPDFGHSYHYVWKNAPICAIKFLLKCINAWVKTEFENQNWTFLETVIVPILKDQKRDQTIVKSYRPIASATSEAWLLEKMVKEKIKIYLTTQHEQFGYKAEHSTIHCIAITKELQGLADCHIGLLDASSAFDCISHKRIYDQLLKRNMPNALIKVVLGLTFHTRFLIRWFGSQCQLPFYPGRGVKQGGCLSSFLFSICYDELIYMVRSQPSGVYLHDTFVQLLIFADDILLVSASSDGLEVLYNTVMEFANQYNDIQMNPSKSVILRLGKSKKAPISFAGIPAKTEAKYLGAVITSTASSKSEIYRSNRGIYAKTNTLLKTNAYIKQCTDDIKKSVLNSYGGVYGIETFAKVDSSTRRAHRYITKNIWPSYHFYKDQNGVNIRSRTLYKVVANGANSLPEIHRKLRNKFIIKSQQSENIFIRNILGKLQLIDTFSDDHIHRSFPNWMKYLNI